MAKRAFFDFLKKRWKILTALTLLGVIALLLLFGHHEEPAVLLSKYGYLVVLVWTLFEGETIVIVAGMLSDSLQLNPWLIALCAFCGSFTIDQLTFSLGKYKGEDVLRLFPRLERSVDKVARLLKKYDTALILSFRFIYGVRNVTPILLGVSGVSHKKFFFLNMIGAAVWAVSFTFGGIWLGQAFLHLIDRFGFGALFILLAVVLLGVGYFYVRSLLMKKKNGSSRAKAKSDSSSV